MAYVIEEATGLLRQFNAHAGGGHTLKIYSDGSCCVADKAGHVVRGLSATDLPRLVKLLGATVHTPDEKSSALRAELLLAVSHADGVAAHAMRLVREVDGVFPGTPPSSITAEARLVRKAVEQYENFRRVQGTP